MPLGEFFSCVWLVLLAFNLMNTFPRCLYCSTSSSFTTTHSSSSSPLSSSSLANSSNSSEPPSQSDPPKSATAASVPSYLCHHSIKTDKHISPDCQQIQQQKKQQPRMRITGNINEGPGPPTCPPSCPRTQEQAEATAEPTSGVRGEKNNSSCYRYLVQKDCEQPRQNDWSEIRLRHCCEHSVREAVPDADQSLNDRQQCESHVNELLELDVFVAKVICQFEQVLLRFDCLQSYSVNSCQDCRDAYRRWVCASLIPHWRQRHKIKPCRSICHTVEQTCPWLLPADKTPGYPAQYAGEPLFQCIDSNIPETGEQLVKSTYGSSCCYEYCEQRRKVEASSTVSYHHLDKSKFPYTRIVSCERGCNQLNSTGSDDASPSDTMSPCQKAAARATPQSADGDATTPSIPQQTKTDGSLPLVNFPLSSCPSEHSHSGGSRTITTSSKSSLSNLVVLSFVFYLLYINTKLIDSR